MDLKLGINSPNLLKSWIKNNKKQCSKEGIFSYQKLAEIITKKQIEEIVEERIEKNSMEVSIGENSKKIVLFDMSREDLMSHAFQRYRTQVAGISDMRTDIENKLLKPIIMRALEKQGFVTTSDQVLSPILETTMRRLYEQTSLSDQLSFSSYWNSTGVNIKRRFQSVVLNADTDYKEWEGLLGDKPFEIEDGIFIYPLNSNTALEEESDAMTSPDSKHRFCIWSYGSSHYTRNYHMLSIRNKDGHRLCSLTVQDFMGEDGKRQIIFSQNKAIDNAEPCETGSHVADTLIEKINKGEIKPDWRAIDAVRQDYNVNQIQNTIGYDFRDRTQAQDVYDVYRSCLPKKIVKASGGQFEGLGKALKVDEAIKDFVSNFDFSQGGLVHISSHQSSPKTQQQRPRVA